MNAVAVVPEPEFNLRAIVKAALEGDEASPHVIAERVIDTLDIHDVWEALRETLPDFVRKVIHSERTVPTETVEEKPRLRQVGSAAQKNIRATRKEQMLLRMRLFSRGDWKFFGDCAIEDVQDLAKSRQELADANAAQANKFSLVAQAMKKRRVETVADLPYSVLEGIWHD